MGNSDDDSRSKLRVGHLGLDAVNRMFDSGRLALFVDGLDEMPTTDRDRALERLTTQAAGLRVTSAADLTVSSLAGHGRPMPLTAVVELHPVNPAAAADYLLADQIGSSMEAWQQVTDHLEDDPGGALAQTLSTPSTLSLARSLYTDNSPTDLLRPDLQTEQALRGHLLDQVLVTAYPNLRKLAQATYAGLVRLPNGPTDRRSFT